MPKFLASIDLSQNQLLKARVENLSTAPATPVTGQVYYNTTSNRLFTWNGTVWVGADANDAVVGTGDISTAKIADGAVTNAKLADMAVNTIKGRITAGTGSPEDLSAANVRTIINVADGANNYSHPNHSGDVTSTGDGATVIGNSKVTNAKMADMAASTVKGRITASVGAPEDIAIETTLAGANNKLARADAIKAYVDTQIAAADAMIFKGTLGTGGTVTALPTTYQIGWTYKVITAATYAGVVCEIGDMIIALVDRAGTGNLNSDWTVVQTNVDGAVVGPTGGVTQYYLPRWSGTSGRVLDAGIPLNTTSEITATLAEIATSWSVFYHLQTNHPKKFAIDATANAEQIITHNLGTAAVHVMIYVLATGEQVFADVVSATTNTVTIRFATAPTAGTLRISIFG